MPELQHISRIEIHKSEREGGNRTPYQKRAPPMVKVGSSRSPDKGKSASDKGKSAQDKGKSAPPEGQCKKTESLSHGKKMVWDFLKFLFVQLFFFKWIYL